MNENLIYQLYKISGHQSSDQQADLITSQLEKVTSFVKRGKGLLGKNQLLQHEGLWISPCNNIHTFFMKFNIDCLFIDQKMKIKFLKKDIKPFRIAGPVWSASSVIELPAGTIQKFDLSIGDQLYVVS